MTTQSRALSVSLTRLTSMTEGDAAGFWRAEKGRLIPTAYVGVSSDFTGALRPIAFGHCLCGRCAESGELVVSELRIPNARRPTLCAQEGLQSALCTPMKGSDDQLIGVVHVASRRGSAFNGASDQVAQSVSDVLGGPAVLEVENVRLRQALNETRERLRELTRTTLHLQERERARIARDLHDSTVQSVTAALYTTQAIQDALEHDPSAARADLRVVQHALQEIEGEIRRAVYNLHPLSLRSGGIVPALQQYVDRYHRSYKISCAIRTTGRPVDLSEDTSVAIFRIVQEALENVALHAQARSAYVGVHFVEKVVQVIVEDDGCSFDPSDLSHLSGGHLGLVSMQERAEAIHADLEIHSLSEGGTRVTLSAPIP